MSPRPWTLLIAVVVLVTAGCGDRSSTSDVVAPIAPEDTAFVAAESTTDVATDVVTAEPTTVAMANGDATLGSDPTSDTGPLGGVTVDDPLPPQSDSATDATVADTAVRFAFRHWILVGLDQDRRARLIEDGEDNVEGIATGFQKAESLIQFARVAVDDVQFTAPDQAQVTFRIQWNDRPSPYFPNPMIGTGVYRNGTWRISHTSLCLLAFGAGQDCARPGEPHPPVPASLEVSGLPSDYGWSGPSDPADLVAVPGTGSWFSVSGGDLSVQAQVLVGVSSVAEADIDTLLASERFQAMTGTPIMVGDRHGRILVADDHITLVVLRPDDVVVSLTASGTELSTDDLVALAGSMVPSTVVPTPFDEGFGPGVTVVAADTTVAAVPSTAAPIGTGEVLTATTMP